MSAFCECETCRKKPGTPVLCSGCIANRRTIESFDRRLKEAASKMDHLERERNHWRQAANTFAALASGLMRGEEAAKHWTLESAMERISELELAASDKDR